MVNDETSITTLIKIFKANIFSYNDGDMPTDYQKWQAKRTCNVKDFMHLESNTFLRVLSTQ